MAPSCSAVAGGYNSREVLDIVFILRVLRLIRVVDSIQRCGRAGALQAGPRTRTVHVLVLFPVRFRTIINTLIRIGPAILTFAQLILVSGPTGAAGPTVVLF